MAPGGEAPAAATSSPPLSPFMSKPVAAQGHALRLKQLEDLPEIPQQPPSRPSRAPSSSAAPRPSAQASTSELVGLGIAARKGMNLVQLASHHGSASQDEMDPDSSVSSLSPLVDAFPPPPSSIPWPNSPPPSSPAQLRHFRLSSATAPSQRSRTTYLSPASSIAEPVSPDYSPAAPPKIPLPPLPTTAPGVGGAWTPPASPLPPPRPPVFDPLTPPQDPLPPLPRPTRSPSLAWSSKRRSSLPLESIGRLPSPPPPSPPRSGIDFDELLAHPLPKKRLSRRRSTMLSQSASMDRLSLYEPSPTRSASHSPSISRGASVLASQVLLEDLEPPADLQSVSIDLGSETSEESELDLDISMDAAGWRAGVMGKDGVGFDSESDQEGRVSPAPPEVPKGTPSLQPPSTTRRRSYQPYKLVRRPSHEPEEESSGSSAEEELFDLAFDSTTSGSTASFSPFSRHSRRSTASSSGATPRQSWVDGVEPTSPPIGWRTNIWGREAPLEALPKLDPPTTTVATLPPSPSSSPSTEPRRLLKSKSAGQLRRPSRSYTLRPEEPLPAPFDNQSSFSDGLSSSPSSQEAPKLSEFPWPTASQGAVTSPVLPARRSSLPSSVALRQLSLPQLNASASTPSALPNRPDRSPRRPPLPPLPPSFLSHRSPTIKPLALVQQFDQRPPPPPSASTSLVSARPNGAPTRLPQRGHARKASSTLRYV